MSLFSSFAEGLVDGAGDLFNGFTDATDTAATTANKVVESVSSVKNAYETSTLNKEETNQQAIDWSSSQGKTLKYGLIAGGVVLATLVIIVIAKK